MERDTAFTHRIQDRITAWQNRRRLKDPARQVIQVVRESIEMEEAYDQYKEHGDPYRERLGEEACDVAVAAIGLIGTLGLDFRQLFERTLEGMELKYDADIIDSLMGGGLSPDEAMDEARRLYSVRHQNGT